MKATTMQSLENKFVLCSRPDFFKTGQIRAVLDGAVLVQFDAVMDPGTTPRTPMHLVCTEELIHAEENGIKVWGFFDTREQRDAFVAWLDGPAQDAQLVKLVPKKPPPRRAVTG
jgi:hypothetical protein